MTTRRTDIARELATLAHQIAAKVEVSDEPEIRKTAAHTLRTLATAILATSESADQLEVQYTDAIKLAKNATDLADQLLPGRKKGALSS